MKPMEHPKNMLWYLQEVQSETCQCGGWKRSSLSFCYSCFLRLPHELREALYRTMGHGFEEAYDAASKYLIEGEVKP